MAFSKILAALFVSMALYEVSMADNVFHVGDSIGWTVGKVNYTLWAETKLFVIGDTIIFNYNKQFHNVLQVTHKAFNSCNTTSPMATFNSGNDSFNITSYGHYYYICGIPGHCQAGLKVDIRVPHPSPTPTPRPKPRPTPGPEPQPGGPSSAPSPSPVPPTPSSPPPSSGMEPSPAPTPAMPAPSPSSGSEPAPGPSAGPGPSWMAPAPAPSPASSIYASVGMIFPSVAVIASVVTAFAY